MLCQTTAYQVEDLFFNMATRRNALKNPGDQYRAILEVVTRYSIHYAAKGISFTCKKVNDPISFLDNGYSYRWTHYLL